MCLCFIIAYPEHQTHLKFHNVPFAKCAIQAHPRHSQTPQIHPAHQTPHATTSKILQLTHSHHIITPHDPPFNLPNLYPLHLAHNSQHPQLKNTYPAPRQHPKNQTLPPPQKPLLFTPHHLYLTLLLQHLLHLKPPSALTLHANHYFHKLLRLPSTRLHPALNTFPSLTSTSLLNLLLCPNFTPRFRPFYLTSTHKHTTIKPQSNHPKPPTFLSLREIFLRFRTVGFIPSSRLVSRKIWRNLQRI